jgi:non-specific serine/threonine protein kinase
MPERIGRYRIERKIGEGGMGVVYAAHDETLDRPIALKVIRQACDEQARRRFWREARVAAAVSHPNVCHIHEVGEQDGALFIAMELLEGEALADRAQRGSLSLPEAVEIAQGILLALTALHERDLVHRDLKPSNVFLTPHGIKLLDFGLARPLRDAAPGQETLTELTQAGTILGTPRYMAPEQVQGQSVDARSDLFAVGAILFELLAGRHAFGGNTMMEVLHATLYDQPPALAGSPAVVAADRVIRQALAKRPEDRPASAALMARALREALREEGPDVPARAVGLTRLIVLPFRILRPDPETDFLASSLPDAITSSLSGLDALVVRSSLTAARFGGDSPDLQRLAAEADVDTVLAGTLLRAGEQLRVVTQLVEAPSGTLLWSQTSQGTLKDIFQLQDELVARIVESLSLPLTAREHRLLKQDVPASPKAYEFYLRANQLALDSSSWELAQQLYEQCLADDPRFAPAWARLGRVHRLIAKYRTGDAAARRQQAETAFRRALELNPELAVGHNLFAQFEVEAGRPQDAMLRLLEQARDRSRDPELLAGLVHVLRYCGLLEASLAADRQARQLDPNIRTSVAYTLWMLGRFEEAASRDIDDLPFMRCNALGVVGRVPDAVALLHETEARARGLDRDVLVCLREALEGRRDESLAAAVRLRGSGFEDPEGLYLLARILSHIGQAQDAEALLRRVVDGGFYCPSPFVKDPWLVPLHDRPEFKAILASAEQRHREAAAAFQAAGGEILFGTRP